MVKKQEVLSVPRVSYNVILIPSDVSKQYLISSHAFEFTKSKNDILKATSHLTVFVMLREHI